ncbi:MAG TPA: response regulator [Ktedonobacterales bacterium]
MEPGETHTVLLIEGDVALRRVIALGLQHQGINVLEAASAQQARALLEQHPSLVIQDIDSAVPSDRLLLPELRARDALSETPAVVLAWECSVEVNEQLAGDGAAVCLAKPFDARRLLDEVGLMLETVAARRAQRQAVAALVGESALAREEESPALVAASVAVAPAEQKAAMIELREVAHTSSPSIWPLVLALGLMLAASGFLFNLAVVVLGVLIVFGAVLLWGFEPTSPRPGEA